MKILYVHGIVKMEGIINALGRLDAGFEVYPKRLVDAFLNEKEAEELAEYIKTHEITHMISVHLVDTLAVAAHMAEITYISIIWDAPYNKLFTSYGRMANCWFSVFDKVECKRFKDGGIRHVIYQPLAVDDGAIREWDSELSDNMVQRYSHEICFVGQLYDNNFYDEFCRNLPPVLQNYFTGVFEEAAFRWDGVNRIHGAVSNEMVEYIRRVTPGFQMVNFFDIEDAAYFENGYIIRKIGNIERICVLNLLAEAHHVTLYTTSKTAAEERLRHVEIKPPICSEKDLHYTFKSSKINLNISLKGIEGGTPQRVMDIMGAGGFVLTNYCAETAELFEEDKEIVMFRTPEELLEKVDYYLTHDEEREQIARAGHEKTMKDYTYENKVRELIDWIKGEEV